VNFSGDRVAVIVVGFRNAGEVRDCVAALSRATTKNFDICVCENGGRAAFQNLCEILARDNFAPNPTPSLFLCSQSTARIDFRNLISYRLSDNTISLFIGEAPENLGYAGAINAWLRILLDQPMYSGFWILNPDTLPEVDALSEMVKYAKSRSKGMVGSRIVPTSDPSLIHSRGLRWRPILASTHAVDFHAPADLVPDLRKVEYLIDAPSGASFYVTRECVEQIGLMDERYFLFFEDLDWGMRAKRVCGLGYAYNAVVRHHGGTTIGSAGTRSEKSKLTVFLEFRNRILFVKQRYPKWYAWTIMVLLVRAIEYGAVGSFRNMRMAYAGIIAGWAGQIGRPEQFLPAADGPERPGEHAEEFKPSTRISAVDRATSSARSPTSRL
jgi:N-acetylglucosaminyl-diphospho-decaprenol L-rhamnosyltransferase